MSKAEHTGSNDLDGLMDASATTSPAAERARSGKTTARLTKRAVRPMKAMLMYSTAIMIGVLAVIPEIPVDLQDVLNVAFGMPLVLGGLFGGYGAVKRSATVEQAGLACMILGIAMRAAIVFGSSTTPKLETASRVGILLLLILSLADRWVATTDRRKDR